MRIRKLTLIAIIAVAPVFGVSMEQGDPQKVTTTTQLAAEAAARQKKCGTINKDQLDQLRDLGICAIDPEEPPTANEEIREDNKSEATKSTEKRTQAESKPQKKSKNKE